MKKIETLLQAAYISEVASTAQALWQAAQNSVPETDVYLSQILDNILNGFSFSGILADLFFSLSRQNYQA